MGERKLASWLIGYVEWIIDKGICSIRENEEEKKKKITFLRNNNVRNLDFLNNDKIVFYILCLLSRVRNNLLSIVSTYI